MQAGVAKLAYAQDLGFCGEIHAGSSPVTRTITEPIVDTIFNYRFVVFMSRSAVNTRVYNTPLHPFAKRG